MAVLPSGDNEKNKKQSLDRRFQPSVEPSPMRTWLSALRKEVGELSPPVLIYGGAATAMFVWGLGFILQGLWLTGIIIFFSACALLGYALYFLKYMK